MAEAEGSYGSSPLVGLTAKSKTPRAIPAQPTHSCRSRRKILFPTAVILLWVREAIKLLPLAGRSKNKIGFVAVSKPFASQ